MSRAEARRRLQKADPNLTIISGKPAKRLTSSAIPRVLSEEEAKQWGLPQMMPIIPPEEILAIEANWSKKALQALALQYFIDPNAPKDILIEKLMYVGAMDEDGNASGKTVEELRERAIPAVVPQIGHFQHSKRYLVNSKDKLIWAEPFDTALEAQRRGLPKYRVVVFGHQIPELLSRGYKVATAEPKPSSNGSKAPMTVGAKTIKDLQKAYEEAKRTNKDEFSIAGFDFATGYAKYLLEYLLEVRKLPSDTPLQDILRKAPRVLCTLPMTFGRKFELGQVVMTSGVAEEVRTSPLFSQFVLSSLRRHAWSDWGEMDEQDKKENDYSQDKHLRLFSAYEPMRAPDAKYRKPELRKIWIITEADRSATTVLFPDEY